MTKPNAPSFINIRVGDILPGSWAHEGTVANFERLGWQDYESTFALLLKNPDAHPESWPIFEPWRLWCVQRFGKMPTVDDALGDGRLWAWQNASARLSKLFYSFRRNGYCPAKIKHDEEYICHKRADGRICVVQGNKRVALLRFFRYENRVLKMRDGGSICADFSLET